MSIELLAKEKLESERGLRDRIYSLLSTKPHSVEWLAKKLKVDESSVSSELIRLVYYERKVRVSHKFHEEGKIRVPVDFYTIETKKKPFEEWARAFQVLYS